MSSKKTDNQTLSMRQTSLHKTKPLMPSLKQTSKTKPSFATVEINPNDGHWDSIWKQTCSSGFLPIHIENENRIHQILRVFDLDPRYGPCIGLTRLERWQRAQDLDLHPAIEIYQILTETNQQQQQQQQREWEYSVLEKYSI